MEGGKEGRNGKRGREKREEERETDRGGGEGRSLTCGPVLPGALGVLEVSGHQRPQGYIEL